MQVQEEEKDDDTTGEKVRAQATLSLIGPFFSVICGDTSPQEFP